MFKRCCHFISKSIYEMGLEHNFVKTLWWYNTDIAELQISFPVCLRNNIKTDDL